MMETKDSLRALIREMRRHCGDQSEQSAAVCRLIESMPEFQSAGTVLSYLPMKGEVDVSRLDCSGRKVILATCGWQDIPVGEIDFAIIPGVAFDRSLNRLGRGGGYYDRLIPLMRCTAVGVAFDWQIVEEVPCEAWDCKVDAVVTPGQIIK